MKVAILCESDADQAAVHRFVNALLGEPTELFHRRFRTQGWSTVYSLLAPVIKELHYTTDVEALAIVLDSDWTLPHLPTHDENTTECRLCDLRRMISYIRKGLTDTGRQQLKCAVGLAMPCMEAWLRFGHDNSVTEAAWLVAMEERQFPYDCRRLKKAIYGTDSPDRGFETKRMIEEAQRICGDISQLEKWYPNGFGPFASEIRSWRTPVAG